MANKEFIALKNEIGDWAGLKSDIEATEELMKLARGDSALEKEIEEKIRVLEEKVSASEFKNFLSGKYDKGSSILSVVAGAGGQDSQDWATMLLRMYLRYCEQKGFKTKILNQSFGEAGGPEGRIGTKSVTLQIKGQYAYGFLKGEAGIHRLVRISPFSAQSLRHTSFSSVEVLPELGKEAEEELKISPQDLRFDFYRASGPGGQNVNKRETATRITHLPTNIIVACQSERSQGQNKETAMKMLYSKLYQLRERENLERLAKLKGKSVSIGWGNQIRSYVLHPYKMVKDLRTGVETSATESVLDGKLDEFIEEEIKLPS